MAKFDSTNNVLGANGQYKIIVAAGGSASTGQILRPTTELQGGAQQDGTLNTTGGVSGNAVRLVRLLVGAGTGAVTLYDANNAAGATAGQIIWSSAAVSAGQSITLDIPTVNGLWVSVGASTTVCISFT